MKSSGVTAGADIAGIRDDDTVAMFGCGPVGQFAILGAKLLEAGRVLAIDGHEDRLAIARRQGAELINFNLEDPVRAIKRLTGGIGVDRAIDAVGVDAEVLVHGHTDRKGLHRWCGRARSCPRR